MSYLSIQQYDNTRSITLITSDVYRYPAKTDKKKSNKAQWDTSSCVVDV